MGADDPATSAVNGLTAWDKMAKLVTAFGGGWQATITISMVCIAVVAIIGIIAAVTYLSTASRHRMKVAIAKLQARYGSGK